MLVDFAIVSALLVIGHLLRARLAFIQALFIPAPLIAGFAGLALGCEGFDVLPFTSGGDGRLAMAGYPLDLVAVLFATLFMGYRKSQPGLRTAMREVGDTFFFNLAAEVGQYGFTLLFGMFVLAPLFSSLNPGFAVMMPAGFAGGHGTATVVGGVLQQAGWEGALSVGYTFATIGLLIGIIGGIGLINIATRRGWTMYVCSTSSLPECYRSGFLEEAEQPSLGKGTVSPLSLDSLAWHVALVLCAFGGAKGINAAVQGVAPGGVSLPLFATAMLIGAAIQLSLNAAGLGRFVDRQVVRSIGSSTSDYLIVFAIASIQVQVVIDHAVPILILSAFGCAYSLAVVVLLGPHMFRNHWFERSVFVFGWLTGVVAIGILLLRVVDPRMQSRTLDDYGVAYVGISVIEIVLLVTVPPLLARGIIWGPAVVLIAAFLLCVVLSRWLRQSASNPEA